MFLLIRLQTQSVICKADITLIMGAFFRLQFGSLAVVVDGLLEVFHYKSHASDQLMQHWTAIDILRGRAQDFISLRKVCHFAENV